MTARRVRVVALDLPTSWMMATNAGDEFTGCMFEAINGMLLDMLAAVARKDYVDRRRRQAQGQAKAKSEGRYKGRPEDAERNDGIARMLAARGSPGDQSRAQLAAAAPRSRRSPSVSRRRPEGERWTGRRFRVLACFGPQWPNLKTAVAWFADHQGVSGT